MARASCDPGDVVTVTRIEIYREKVTGAHSATPSDLYL
jgi:hypothetical protein